MTTNPANPERMKENERWAGHIMFLTIAAALAAGLIAAIGTILADPAKIAGPSARYLVWAAAFFAVVTLGAAVIAAANLSNFLILSDQWSADERKRGSDRITQAAGIAFFALTASAVALLGYAVASLSADDKPARPTIITLEHDASEALAQTAKATTEIAAEIHVMRDDADQRLKQLEDRIRKLEQTSPTPARR